MIAGRRMLYGGPFKHLGSLERGDRIAVTTGQGAVTYLVVGVKRYPAKQGSVFGDWGDNRLTLFTADPPLRGSRRLVVTAKLVERPYAATDLSRTSTRRVSVSPASGAPSRSCSCGSSCSSRCCSSVCSR